MLAQLLKAGDLALLILLVTSVSAATNDGITLAISPTCGKLSTSGNTADVNAGLLDIKSYKTIVSFGDSYTSDGKKDGSAPDPAVVVPPNPHAGGRTTNGPVWIENIANDIGATFKDYAVASSVTDLALWPDSKYDFVTQLNTFLSQNNTLNPSTTLYTIYFGINDNIAAAKSGNTANLAKAAQVILDKIQVLSNAPTNGRSFLITDSYGLGKSNTAGDAYKKKIFNGLASLQAKNSALKFGFAVAPVVSTVALRQGRLVACTSASAATH
ncbi:hypothetical protein FRC09_020489 [Ceratobasidium sp. 395]|nr:hypothetical protein FRC09_020489 [Ceratobasidium sp. 395]